MNDTRIMMPLDCLSYQHDRLLPDGATFLCEYIIEVLLGRTLPCQDRRHLSISLLGTKPESELISKDGTVPPAYGIIYSTTEAVGRSLIISVGIDRLVRYLLRTLRWGSSNESWS